MKILIETSARHIHLDRKTLDILCGKNFELVPVKKLSQPGSYASQVRLEIVGPKRSIKNVSVLGPLRNANQIEISKTDARSLGIEAFIRESGNLFGSAPIKIIGPAGSVDLSEGAIVAKRHIHMQPIDAEKENLSNGDIVSVKVDSPERSLIFSDVVVRVSDKFSTVMHIDTDESNAANIFGEQYGIIIKNNNI
ncbi:MAG: phosphate propanoyltransferase [Bacilli bacterium]|nr:phosphate propanoyltransferase [Bacilli bacterium]